MCSDLLAFIAIVTSCYKCCVQLCFCVSVFLRVFACSEWVRGGWERRYETPALPVGSYNLPTEATESRKRLRCCFRLCFTIVCPSFSSFLVFESALLPQNSSIFLQSFWKRFFLFASRTHTWTSRNPRQSLVCVFELEKRIYKQFTSLPYLWYCCHICRETQGKKVSKTNLLNKKKSFCVRPIELSSNLYSVILCSPLFL